MREFARMYDAGMGMISFAPIAILSWFLFVSTFQCRQLFNQAFTRGLEISKILGKPMYKGDFMSIVCSNNYY